MSGVKFQVLFRYFQTASWRGNGVGGRFPYLRNLPAKTSKNDANLSLMDAKAKARQLIESDSFENTFDESCRSSAEEVQQGSSLEINQTQARQQPGSKLEKELDLFPAFIYGNITNHMTCVFYVDGMYTVLPFL